MAVKTFLKTTLAIFLLFLITYASATVHAKTIYVDDDATGANDGSSWANAYQYLGYALDNASSGDDIHVAQGIYKPSEGYVAMPDFDWRTKTFQLINGVILKGGYAGFGQTDPDARDIEFYETILSGDLNGDDELGFENNSENSYHVVTSSGTDASAVLDGFTITGGNANAPVEPYRSGGGIYNIEGSPTIRYCTIRNNMAGIRGGGGMYNRAGSPSLSTCTFIHNQAARGAGMKNVFAEPTLSYCAFIENIAENGGGGLINDHSNSFLSHCIFKGNVAERAGGMYSYMYSDLTVINCVFVANRAYYYGGAMTNVQSSVKLINSTLAQNTSMYYGGGLCNRITTEIIITNCILWANRDSSGMSASAQIYNDEVINPPLVHYSCIQGGWSDADGQGNIDADPRFARDPDDGGYAWGIGGIDDYGDLRLVCGSPCLDTGSNTTEAPLPDTDLDGDPRIVNGTVDMGAYEGPHQAFVIAEEPVLVPEGGMTTFTVRLTCQPSGTISVAVSRIDGDEDITVKSGETLTFDETNFSTPQNVVLTAAEDDDRFAGQAIILVNADEVAYARVFAAEMENDVPSILYVDAGAPAGGKGSSWADAFNDLQDALTVASGSGGLVNEIRVAEGIYHPDCGTGNRSLSFKLINGVAIHGGFPAGASIFDERNPKANATILSGDIGELYEFSDNTYHVVTGNDSDSTAILDGFTITGGHAYPEEEESDDAHGAGMQCKFGSPTLRNCILRDNSARSQGGGMYNQMANPTVIGCVFSRNTAGYTGGGMSNRNGNPKLVNCSFIGNAASDGGGAVWNSGAADVVFLNCMFSGNAADGDTGGAIESNTAVQTLFNCTFSGNNGAIEIYDYSVLNMQNCIVANDRGRLYFENDNALDIDYCCIKNWVIQK
ncbi:MAG: choice-of-anchor Q domain-containing protein, partial [Planctomycetota bacterium]